MTNDERDIVAANVALWQLLQNMKQLRAMCYRNDEYMDWIKPQRGIRIPVHYGWPAGT